MVDAKKEIIETVFDHANQNPILSQVEDEDILEIIEHLFESQFYQDDNKTRKFIESKINEIASELVRKETIGE